MVNRSFGKNLVVSWESMNLVEKDSIAIYDFQISETYPTEIKSKMFQSELKYQLIAIKNGNEMHSYIIEAYSSTNHPLYSNSIRNIINFTGTLKVYTLNGKHIGQLVISNGKSISPSSISALTPLNKAFNLFYSKKNLTSRVPNCSQSEHVYVVYWDYKDYYSYVTVGTVTTKTFAYTKLITTTIDEPISVPCGQSEDSYGTYRYVTSRSEVIIDVADAIEDQIDDSVLDPCTKEVFQQIKNTTQCDFTQLLIKLGADGSIYKTVMKTEHNNDNHGNPITSPANTVKTPGTKYEYTVYINPDYQNKTKLFIAAMLLHEMTHTYFFSLLDDYNSGATNSFYELPILYNAFQNHTSDFNANLTHEEIANSYVNAISAALKEYQPGLSQQVYDDMAWGGLIGTPIFDSICPNGNSNRQRIINRYTAEQEGRAIAQGTSQEQKNYGQPCN